MCATQEHPRTSSVKSRVVVRECDDASVKSRIVVRECDDARVYAVTCTSVYVRLE